VFRGGWGVAYGFAPDVAANSSATSNNTAAGLNGFVNLQSAGALPRPVWPNFDPGQSPLPGQITGFGGLGFVDPNSTRPPRQNQWSIGIQREISRDFVLEASYVGNRGVWWTGPLGYLNQITPQAAAAYGLHPYTNAADNLLLSSTLASVASRFPNILPYSGYATSNTLANALRPYPQFSTALVTASPTGATYYDSLQVKGTKRMTHGLQVNGTFTWSKAMLLTREDIFNPVSSKSIQSTDQPFLFNANIVYQTQKWFSNNLVSTITKDWQFGAFLQYGSGLPLTPPAANTTNNLGASEMIRTGQPLFLKNLNCGCIDVYNDQVLNPAAWKNPDPGTFGPGPSGANTLYYTDYRGARHPQESLNIGRNFKIKERMNLQIRAEFANILNRTELGNPILTTPVSRNLTTGVDVVNAPTKNNALTVPPGGTIGYTGGFGVYQFATIGKQAVPSGTTNSIAPGMLFSLPRQGTLIARFTF
jgi:hypothetical protein